MNFKVKFQVLASDYVAPVGNDSFLRMPKAGNPIKFIIVGQAITGFSYWTEAKQCLRFREYPKSTPGIKVEDSGKTKVSHFWMLPVYDCASERVKMLEITQRGIQDQLSEIISGGDYDLGSLDNPTAIRITAIGEGITTKYTLMPVPSQINDLPTRLESDPMAETDLDALVFEPPTNKSENSAGKPSTPHLPAIPPTEALDRM